MSYMMIAAAFVAAAAIWLLASRREQLAAKLKLSKILSAKRARFSNVQSAANADARPGAAGRRRGFGQR